jgi:predicted Zn finger-like uncharacterized protein
VKFNCPGCQMSFFVPDDKVPEGKGRKIPCPKCRTPMESGDVTGASGELEKAGRSSTPSAISEEMLDEASSALEMVEDGMKTSLLCCSDPDRSGKMEQMLRQLDFYVSVVPTATLALTKLRNNRYDLVVLDELFDAGKQSDNLVLHHIQFLPMHSRRQFFLCLLSETLPSMDQFLTFRIGADLILNVSDLDKTKIILVRALREQRSFYKIFNSELEKKGQYYEERTLL